ncbi:MAG: 16S rRNA processing protein RimM [Anaerolineae bacterium]|jgi:16S rRNA processing protein RimM|nr:MAG: 16S rRNA processing protein RimM [Anaerolineae bacterium]MCL4877698.1 16S rRNA processing protein RimM [Anaerolineae bacterium]
MADPRYLIVGQVLRPHGIRGELRVQLTTHYPERLKTRTFLVFGADPEREDTLTHYEVERVRLHLGYGIVKLETINSREEADLLRGQYVFIPLEEAVPLEPDEYYYFQLIGLEMVTESGELVGTVAEILETGANEVYVVRGTAYGEVLIPAIDSIVKTIDPATGRIIITPIPGLLPDN